MALACLHWWLFLGEIPLRFAQSGLVPFRLNVAILSSAPPLPPSSSASSASAHATAAMRSACCSYLAVLQVPPLNVPKTKPKTTTPPKAKPFRIQMAILTRCFGD
jgi:hypothetical protein